MAKKKSDLTDQLRQVIDDCGLSRYRLSRETGISEPALSQFCTGKRGLSMTNMNRLGQFLELRIVMGRKPDTKG